MKSKESTVYFSSFENKFAINPVLISDLYVKDFDFITVFTS
jgi:hypothetical protein